MECDQVFEHCSREFLNVNICKSYIYRDYLINVRRLGWVDDSDLVSSCSNKGLLQMLVLMSLLVTSGVTVQPL